MEDVVVFADRFRGLPLPPAGLFVACTDLRAARIVAPEVSELMLRFMRTRKTKIEHNALLISDSSIIGLQVERLIKGASHPGREVVRSVADALVFLDPLCTAEE